MKSGFEYVYAVDAKLEDGTTPLILAAALGPENDSNADVVKALLVHKANPLARDFRGYSVS